VGKKCCWWEAFVLIRLHILVEGQTEEGLVKNVLAPALGEHSVFADAHSITTSRRRGQIFRGGLKNYEIFIRDLLLWMKQDQQEGCWFTSMVDFYRLPTNFPGYETILPGASALNRVAHLENELAKDVAARIGDLPVATRFIPYIQLHEFEALLFSEPRAFINLFPERPDEIATLEGIRAVFPNPEDINQGYETAPSKRILKVLPDYQKSVAGILIAQSIGLPKIRSECPHFGDWYAKLIALAG
jgi:hypothetical protein